MRASERMARRVELVEVLRDLDAKLTRPTLRGALLEPMVRREREAMLRSRAVICRELAAVGFVPPRLAS